MSFFLIKNVTPFNYIKMKKIILTIILFSTIIRMFSQETTKNFTELSYMQDSLGMTENGGNVTVTQDEKLEIVINNFSKAFKLKPEKVWRVQIYFGIGREARIKAQNIKKNFEKEHVNISAYLVFEEPYFKVKVGDFETKLDAERFKTLIINDYQTLFITEDIQEEF